ncbi:MAG: phospho-sugar mutase [Acidobacteria bacterium]|nr:phospho-sugar mutase [Acidobacteriota bacterium]
MNPELLARVGAWLAADPDEADRATIERLLDADDEVEIHRRFDEPLRFGTAGLRGPEMAGPAGMNRCTVRRATQGVVAWLRAIGVDTAAGVVVGRDARHGSASFNDEVVAVLLGAGVGVHEMPRPLPTPLTAYAVTALGAAAGIMITASHNPPADNGYKLYGPDGSQIVPPHDAMVERYANEAPTAVRGDRSSPLHHVVGEELLEEYREHMRARFAVTSSDLSIAYTPLHGVGGAFMADLFARSGFSRVALVDEQFRPDPTFPGLPFPNPEEPGVLDAGIARANASGATLLIANDPDADRLGAAVRATDGTWRVLRGDEIGWLLGSVALAEAKDGDVVATTIVSSSMLEKMAARAGVPYVTTLTGFKWIAKAAPGRRLAFGYEEALGFAVDPCVADKDGLSAALALARLAHDLARHGLTLLDRLDELEARYGVHAGAQLSLRVGAGRGREVLAEVMARVRSHPPTVLGGTALSEVIDLETGYGDLAPTEGLIWRLGSTGRVVVRPSGTEPKLKAYVEVVAEPSAEDVRAQRRRATALLEAIREDLASVLALDD